MLPHVGAWHGIQGWLDHLAIHPGSHHPVQKSSAVEPPVWRSQVYAAAKSMLGSSKLPVRMAGVSLSAALYAAEGAAARDDLGVEDLESRIKAQVSLSCCKKTFVR